MIKIKTNNVKLDGMKGTWYFICAYHTVEGSFYLWESEQHGEDCPAVLTDDKMRVLDTCCYSGIYVALLEHGLISFM